MSVVDMVDIENQIGEVVDAFEEKMRTLYEEEPDSFAVPNEDGSMGRISEQNWKSQVVNCGLDLNEALCKVVEKFESKLHNGDYYDEWKTWHGSARRGA
jgi:hypothetical protein